MAAAWMRGLPAIAAGRAAQSPRTPQPGMRGFSSGPSACSTVLILTSAGERERSHERGPQDCDSYALTGRGPGRQAVVLSGPLEVTPMADAATATMSPLTVMTFPAEIDMATAGAIGEQIAAALAA